MQTVIGTYECEWKKAVEDPEIRKRFRHFVNSEKLDANIVLVEERGQRRPATQGERAGVPVSA
jgi:nitrite reductase (NADH) large subunit